MSYDKAVSDNYKHGNLLGAIEAALGKLGKTIDTVTVEDLGPVDEFHIGGRLATETFLDQLKFSESDRILDVGCGLGGATRYVAQKYDCRVSGIDLSHEYVDTGNTLTAWVKLDNHIDLQQGSALSMPFEKESFDGGYMLHVAMNIEDKVALFTEVYRVLRPNATFGVYDVMRMNGAELTFPVPWAADGSISHLATADEYKRTLEKAGFTVTTQNNRRDFAIEFFNNLRAKNEASGGPPPLGLHTLMKESTPEKIKNMIEGIAKDSVAPVEMIAVKTHR